MTTYTQTRLRATEPVRRVPAKRNTATQTVLTVGPDIWGGTPMDLKPAYGMAAQRFSVDWRYTG